MKGIGEKGVEADNPGCVKKQFGGEAGSVFGMVASAMGFSRTILLSAGVLEAARRGSAGSAAALAGGGVGSAGSETVSGCDGEAFLERRASCSSRIWKGGTWRLDAFVSL